MKFFWIIMIFVANMIVTGNVSAGVLMDKEWRDHQSELSRLRRQIVGVGIGPMIHGIPDEMHAMPVITSNIAFLWGDYYIGKGGSLYVGGRIAVGSSTEIVPLGIGATFWHSTPLWAEHIERWYDISMKAGFTVRILRYVEMSVFISTHIPDPIAIMDAGEEDVEDNINCFASLSGETCEHFDVVDNVINAMMPKIVLSIRGVYDLRRVK